jgi:hypothetical protein
VEAEACRISLGSDNKKTNLQSDTKNDDVLKDKKAEKELTTTSSTSSSEKESDFVKKFTQVHAELSSHFKNMRREVFSDFREILGSESDVSTSTILASDTSTDKVSDKRLLTL